MIQLAYADRIQETAENVHALTTIQLLGRAAGNLRTFAEGGLSNKTVPYCIEHRNSGQWEIGYGIYEAAGAQLTRVVVFCNSDGTTGLVDFSFGVVDVWNDLPAEKMVSLDADSDQLTLPGALVVTGTVTADHFHGPLSGPMEWTGIVNTPTTLAGYGITDAFTKTESDARYVQSGGGGGSVPWTSITGTPTTIAGYGITDAYTKSEVYSKVESDARFAPIAVPWATITGTPTTRDGYGITDVFTKTESDARYVQGGGAGGSVTWTQITGTPTTIAGYGITDAYTKSEVYSKVESDGRFAPIAGPFPWAGVTGRPTTLAGYGITDAASATGPFPWAGVTGRPTTLAGYGITDAFTQAQSDARYVQTVTGTAGRIVVTGGLAPVINIDPAYVGQASITTLGTITTGVWNGTPIGPTVGGTGLTSYATGDLLYASAANTLAKRAIGTANQILTVVGGVPTWVSPTVAGPVTAADVASGTFPGVYGFASTVSITGALTLTVPLAPTSGGTGLAAYATGDILYASAANTLSKLAIGTTNQALTVVGGVPTWTTLAPGGVTSVTGTAGRIAITGTASAPVVNIQPPYVGQSSITTVGTITSGTWNGTPITTTGTITSGTWNGAPIGPTFGGTGLTSYATGDMLYASAANTLAKLAVGTAGQVLTVAGGLPTWATATVSAANVTPGSFAAGAYTFPNNVVISGALQLGTTLDPVYGGTGQSAWATGDLLYGSATNATSRRSIGTAGQVLTVVGGVPAWAAAAGGGTVSADNVTSGTFPGTYTFASGLSVTGNMTATGNVIGNRVTVTEPNNPVVLMNATGAGTDQKYWALVTGTNGNFDIRAYNDALGASNPALSISRSGDTPTTASFATNVTISGTATISGSVTMGAPVVISGSTGAGMLRVGVGVTNSYTSGAGLEVTYSTSANALSMFSYERGTGLYKGMVLDGFPLTLNSSSGGAVVIGTDPGGTERLRVGDPIRAMTKFSSYTADGLFGAAALPCVFQTPGGVDRKFLIGYVDGASGQYSPRIGFTQPTAAGGLVASKTSIGLEINGDMSFTYGASDQRGLRLAANGNLLVTNNVDALAYTMGGSYVLRRQSTLTVLSTGDGADVFYAGTTASDPSSYYNSDNHYFRNRAATVNLMSLGPGGIVLFGSEVLQLTDGYIYKTNSGAVLLQSVSSSSACYIQLVNAQTNVLWGIEGSPGGSLLSGATAGAMVWGNATAGRTIELFTNNVRRVQITDSQMNVNYVLACTSTVTCTRAAATQSLGAVSSVLAQHSHASSPAGVEAQFTAASPNNNSVYFYKAWDTTNTKAMVYSNGGLANFSANNANLSDARLKTPGTLIAPAEWWDRIAALEIRSYRYLDQTDDVDHVGVYAQQVQLVAPSLVLENAMPATETTPGYLGVRTTDLYHAHLSVTQELQRRIVALEGRFRPVASVTIAALANSVKMGNTDQCTAVLKDANGVTLVGRTVAWASSNDAIATVDQNGLVTGVGEGTITITATSEGISGTDIITVTP